LSKKVAAEDPREKRKKKAAEEEMASKSVTGLSLKLAELETDLRNSYLRPQEKVASKEERLRVGRANIRSGRLPVKGAGGAKR